ncbi:TetR/AcrR family transcriptional regulator [Sciscionella sediminilitoris]|uniref:TetR/AcrR family transcriptional regulator n=1 Tax=Sciscionella sediminilitoris TaxID=1445613 RepID=UPI0004DF95A5|nr:TetR/AcrR family transcriptional regulator [Sciscionella sp. SE31]
MARPARFSTEDLLDVAVSLAAHGGPAAVTMAAVARAAGAPSGSLYHRFPGRAALLAGTWLHAVEAFQQGCAERLRARPALSAAVGTAWFAVDWSRRNPERARVLLHGAGEFDQENWPEAERIRLGEGNTALGALLRELAGELRTDGETAEHALERLRLAVVDLPLALVRRHLLGGELGAGVAELAASSAQRLLEPP